MYLYVFEIEYKGTYVDDASMWAESQLEAVDMIIAGMVADGYDREHIVVYVKV